MRTDAQGLVLTAGSDAAAQAYVRAVESFAKYRVDTAPTLEPALADTGFPMAHCLKGYLTLLANNRAWLPLAATALAAAETAAAGATPRERKHVAALAAWHRGNLIGALAAWEAILAEHPTDLVAARFSHFWYFWLGRAADMRASTERTVGA